MQPHELTSTSLHAIRERREKTLFAKICAEQRYLREQEITKAKKQRNRSLLSMAIFFIGLTSVAFSMGHTTAETGAKAGPIRAKSELTPTQIKALNVMPTVAEKRK